MPTKKPNAKKATAPRRPVLPLALIGVVLLAAVGAGAWYLRSSRESAGAVAQGEPGAQPARALGPQDAPVTLEEFGDYQCPPCAQAYPEVERIREEFGDRLRFVFRHYPLTRIHPHALLAAHAAESAGLQGKFWEMHRLLYEEQRAWANTPDPRPAFDAFARRAGLDVERFRRDLGGAEADARLVADHGRARSVGVESTPAFFVNGRKLTAAGPTPAALRSAIRRALGQ
ncbi:MAG: thioredoxin domain-containing protein [Acidobacteria bacterium]|nr:thioredoxin domain-containing protein [Acidobacteriota bacterium]